MISKTYTVNIDLIIQSDHSSFLKNLALKFKEDGYFMPGSYFKEMNSFDKETLFLMTTDIYYKSDVFQEFILIAEILNMAEGLSSGNEVDIERNADTLLKIVNLLYLEELNQVEILWDNISFDVNSKEFYIIKSV